MNHTVTPLFAHVRVAFAFILVIFLAATVYACSNRYNAATTTNASSTKAVTEDELLPDGARRVKADNGKVVVVRAMDDPDNPYHDEYKPWDYWFFDHLLAEVPEYKPWSQLTEDERAERIARRKAGMSWLKQRHHLDENGFIVPDTRSIREHEEGVCDNTFQDRHLAYDWIVAEGEVDPDMHLAMWQAGYAVSAEYYSEIPAWLAENPPFEAMLLPNGDVITHGLLGDYEKEGSTVDCCGGQGSIVARYDSGGNLIRTLKDSIWFYLYYDADLNPKPEGMPSTSIDGYITFRDPVTGVLLSVWDWDGTQLPTEEPAWRDPHPFTWLNAKRLANLYHASQDS